MMLDCKLRKSVLESIEQLLKNTETEIQIYKGILRSLAYPTQESRSDLSFVIERLAQISPTNSPTKKHWDQLFHIFVYISENLDLEIEYNENHRDSFLQIFCDSDWTECYYE